MDRELQAQLCSRFRPLKGGDASIGSDTLVSKRIDKLFLDRRETDSMGQSPGTIHHARSFARKVSRICQERKVSRARISLFVVLCREASPTC
jgi:hypothetical protein